MSHGQHRHTILDYATVPVEVGDQVGLLHSPLRGRTVEATGIVIGVNTSWFGVRITQGRKIAHRLDDGVLVITRETIAGVDTFVSTIDQSIVRDDDVQLLCRTPVVVERIERRGAPRARVEIPLLVALRNDPAGFAVETETDDLSERGCQFRCSRSFAVGDLLDLAIRLPGAPARATASVARVEPPRIGGDPTYRVHCRFTWLDPSLARGIAALVDGRRRSWRPGHRWHPVNGSSTSGTR
jgi:PilZ domain